ncbi:MAG: glycosyltransferase family 9 protein [Ferruginibacter sp.]|nr:glycosyltransferase family 9 protein [Chitinophagaceae bacterium]MBP6286642.1 glycosyltransferase family 9 protein [Ferruginibacter sp.]MBU9937207.1 glycosyltransferase family 9 protein [Ferruginibacter sp.]
MQKFLVIQTAFIGDVVLGTALVEKLTKHYPHARIDFLVRKGNESLLENNPHLSEVLTWDKKKRKLRNLLVLLLHIRKTRYDKVITIQRFFSTGLLTAFSGANETIGFDKNPLSFLFSKKVKHIISKENGIKHEVERNNDLIESFTDGSVIRPRLYPSEKDHAAISAWTQKKYVTISPGSIWFTKRYPFEKWADLIRNFPPEYAVYLVGGKENIAECEYIKSISNNPDVDILAGKLSFLQSAALMETAAMNYVNDSGPLHFASAVNAPVTAVYCSTAPAYGFTPLSDKSYIVETPEKLNCRPCGIHGHKTCPEQHFKCAKTIQTNHLLEAFQKAMMNV